MNSLIRKSLLIVISIQLIQYVQAQNFLTHYPEFNKNYPDSVLQLYRNYYLVRNDSLGLAYTYANWSKTQGEHYTIELDKFKSLLKYVPVVKKVSENDYYHFMLLLIQYYYISQDYHSIQRSLITCDSIIAYGIRSKNSNLQFGAYLFKINFMLRDPLKRKIVNNYVKKAGQLAKSKIQKIYYYYSLAAYLREEKKYDESIEFYKKGFDLNPKIGSINNQTFIFLFLAQVYRLKKDYKNATKSSQKELSVLSNPQNSLFFEPVTQAELRRWANQELALVYQEQKNYQKAASHWLKFNIEVDKLASLKNKYGEFSDLQMEIIEHELKLDNALNKFKQKILTNENHRKNNQLVTSIIILVLLILLIFTGLFTFRQRLEQLLNKRKISILQLQEAEHQEIAKELHDHIGSMLVGIKAQMLLNTSDNRQLIGWLDSTYNSVRRLSHTLHSGVLDEDGLPQACFDFIKLIDTKHIIKIQVHGKPVQLPSFTIRMAYRIIQVLLINALQHANANSVLLTLLFSERKLLISVEDDGIGFDTKIVSSGLGLRSIKERIETLHGQIEINSSEKTGTTVLVTLPIEF